jgi:hypothetical protein
MPDSNTPGTQRGPNCWQCRFFAISWDPRKPYACHRLGFKTHVLPAIEVLRVDGQPCHGFTQREATAEPITQPKADQIPPKTGTHQYPAPRLWQA